MDNPNYEFTYEPQIEALTPDAQKLVGEFVKLLKKQYQLAKPSRKPKKQALDLGDFIGMWKDRPEMEDSVAYVRELRRTPSAV